MKQSLRALVVAALVLAAATPAAHAVAPVVEIEADAALGARSGGVVSPRLHINVSFATDTPGAAPFTISKAVIYFPDKQATNGRFFPTCSAAQIARWRGNIGRCPKGSRLGGGTLSADALQLGITAYGRVALFNGPGGRSVTFNIQAQNPALINESIDAPLAPPSSAQGEHLTLVLPHSLQEIIEGVFVGARTFDVTISATTRVRGVDRPYIAARTCPPRGMRGVFDFQDWTTGQVATTTTEATLRCTEAPRR